MNIVFFGTPDFAVPSLRKLLESSHKILAVVTSPDKERGRGRSMSYTPVKKLALRHGLKIFEPQRLKDSSFIDEIKKLCPDLFVVVAFRILPPEILRLPLKGSINLHGSLLPKYRGAAPIQWGIINGEKKTGLTVFFIEEKVDTGAVLLREEIPIEPQDNFGSLHDKMSQIGSELLMSSLRQLESGNFILQPQDDALATPAPKISREICKIDWRKSTDSVVNLVRGLSPSPGAYFMDRERVVKVYSAVKAEGITLNPGKFLRKGERLYAGTEDGAIEILELQIE